MTNPPRVQLVTAAVATVLLALIAGFFYAYACSVMIGLADTDDRTFIAAMQAINANVRNAGFAPSFFGAFAVTALAALLGARRWRNPATVLLALAALSYGVGGLALTMAISVPLNNDLAAAGPPDTITDPSTVRTAYEGPWITWNLVRTIASTIAFAFAAASLYYLGRDAHRDSRATATGTRIDTPGRQADRTTATR